MTSAGNLSDTFEDTWIDVGFWVLPDGRVTGLEVVRHQSRTDWAEPLLESIAGRVYSAAPQATYRLERYSYTAGYEQRTGSRLFQRTMAARAEYFDLTESASRRHRRRRLRRSRRRRPSTRCDKGRAAGVAAVIAAALAIRRGALCGRNALLINSGRDSIIKLSIN